MADGTRLRMIPIDTTGTFHCGEGPNDYRLVEAQGSEAVAARFDLRVSASPGRAAGSCGFGGASSYPVGMDQTPRYIETLRTTFDYEAFLAQLIEWLPSFVSAVLIFIVYYVLYRVLRRAASVFIRRASLDPTAGEFVQTLVRSVLLTIGVVAALGRMGVNTASLLASLGVAGLTLGFAAKDALSNMVAGIFIFWDRPFVLGDLIEVDGQYGRVSQITLRSTRVVTPDGRMLAVPNTTIVNTTVASYTNFPHLRLDIGFTVGVEEDLDRVRAVALGVCERFEGLIDTPQPVVVVTALNDYNVAMELRAWLGDEKQHVMARMGLREQVFLALRSAGVDMPYETLALHQPPGMAAAS